MEFEHHAPGLADRLESVAEKVPRWVFPALYWPAFAFVGLMFAQTGPMGLVGVAAPVLLVLAVRWRGLDRAPALLWVLALFALCWAGFFMAMYYRGVDGSKPLVVVGAIGFIVAIKGFARMLRRTDRRYRERMNIGPSDRAEHRAVLIGLILATVVLAVTWNAGAIVCLFALVVRGRLTALLAAVAALLAGSLSYTGGFHFDVVGAITGVAGAWEWIKASRNPYWSRWGRILRRVRTLGAGAAVVPVLAAATVLVVAAPPASSDPGGGQIASASSGKCVDLGRGHSEDSAWVIQWPCHGRDNQRWLITPDPGGGGVVKIRSGLTNKCVDVEGKSGANGALVHHWGCQDAPGKKDASGGSQLWRMVGKSGSNGWNYHTLQNVRSGKCLDLPGSTKADGARLIQFDCTGAQNQLWRTNGGPPAMAAGGGAVGGPAVLELCPHDNRKITVPAELSLGRYDQKSHPDGARTCTFDGRHRIAYSCSGGAKTELHVVESHREFKVGPVHRNVHVATCDGITHTMSADQAFAGRTGPFHLHWRIHSDRGWASWNGAHLKVG